MAGWKRTSIFPSGLHEDDNPHALRPGDLVEATNIAHFDNLVGTRPGISRLASGQDYDARLTGSPTLQGIFEYRRDFDNTRVLVVVANHSGGDKIWYNDTSRYGIGTATITTGNDNLWTMTEHNNVLWGAGGAAGDSFWYLDASDTSGPAAAVAVTLPVSGGSNVFPQYVFSWRGYLLCNGLRPASGVATAADSNPSVTRFCTFATDPATAANWAVGNTIGFAASRRGIDSYGTDFSTGFGAYQDNNGDFLLLLGNKTISSVVLDPTVDFAITDHIANGCVAQDAFISLGLDAGDAIYVSNRGVHSLKQSQEHGSRSESFLSYKIRETFGTINRSRARFIVGGYDHINGRAIFAVPTGSNTFNDTLLVLDIPENQEITAETARWSIWKVGSTSGIVIQKILFGRDSTGAYRWYFATRTGDVLTLSDSVFADFDATNNTGTVPYSVRFQTHHDAMGSILDRKTIGDIMVTLKPGGSYQPTYRTIFDYGQTQGSARALNMREAGGDELGSTFILGESEFSSGSTLRDEKVYGVGSGRTIGHAFSHSGENQPFFVARIDMDYMTSGEDAGDAAA